MTSRRSLALLTLILGLIGGCSLSGCAVAKPSDVAFLDASAANAAAFDAKVQLIEQPTPDDWIAVKTWIHAQKAKARYLSDWGHRRAPATQPAD